MKKLLPLLCIILMSCTQQEEPIPNNIVDWKLQLERITIDNPEYQDYVNSARFGVIVEKDRTDLSIYVRPLEGKYRKSNKIVQFILDEHDFCFYTESNSYCW